MSALNAYLMDAQTLLREQKQDMIAPEDLIRFINRARRDIAMRGQCIRVTTPISNGIESASIILEGAGYTGATIGISPPDFPSGRDAHPNGDQAIGSVVLSGGSVASVAITYGGAGYFQPTASIVGDGAGASVTLQTAPINVLNQGQEVYPFSDVDLSQIPGAGAIYMVRTVTVIFANYRYALPIYPFGEYQAKIRQYPFQYQYVPSFASQQGQGSNGNFYVYPLPSQTYQYELDCFCIPQDLVTDNSVELLAAPWTDGVAYGACVWGMMSLQNYNAANFYKTLYDEYIQRYGTYARPGKGFNAYGRY